jgi:ABC-type Mn2+/Zn2+ transport system permease subunit
VVEWLVEPYTTSFMQRALLAALLVGVAAPAVGVWIVLRRLAYLGDAMSHGLLAGVAVAFALGGSTTLGALAAAAVMALLIGVLTAHPRLREDAVIGVVGTGLFALGVVLVARRSGALGVDLTHLLFGQITVVDEADLALNAALVVGVVAALWLLHRDLLAATFDPAHAALVGVPVGLLRHVLLLLLAAAIVVSLQTVGLLMSVAMLVTPAAAARLLAGRVATMTVVAVGIGVTSAWLGLTLSYHLAAPPGASVALVAAAILVVVSAATAPRRSGRRRVGALVDAGIGPG